MADFCLPKNEINKQLEQILQNHEDAKLIESLIFKPIEGGKRTKRLRGGGKINASHVAVFLTALMVGGFCYNTNMMEYIKFLKDSFGESLLSMIGLVLSKEGRLETVKSFDFFNKLNLLHTVSGKFMPYIRAIAKEGVTVENVLPKPLYDLIDFIVNNTFTQANAQTTIKMVKDLEPKTESPIDLPVFELKGNNEININYPATLTITKKTAAKGGNRCKKSKHKSKHYRLRSSKRKRKLF
jgi:hypothetical protein